jgi:hypothetical protein
MYMHMYTWGIKQNVLKSERFWYSEYDECYIYG